MTLPDPNFVGQDPIERAKLLGTYNQIDRRAQYDMPDRARPEVLLHSHNAQWNQLRALQVENGRLVNELSQTRQELKHANVKIWILSLIVSPLIAVGVRTLLGMVR